MGDNIEELKEGDVVMLKSGGPKMTVAQVATFMGHSGPMAQCQWFENKKMETALFPPSSLKKVEAGISIA